MSEHPILFSQPMVQANLADRKTMTRRMTGLDKVNEDPDSWEFIATYHIITKGYFEVCFEHKKTKEKIYCHAPYGLPGDLLWVRETWRKSDFPEHDGIYEFKASMGNPDAEWNKGIWKPSIHMPKAAARIWLEVEEIRVERLNEISAEDARAEGIKRKLSEGFGFDVYFDYKRNDFPYPLISARESFKTLFLSINGKPKPQREFGEKGKIVSYTAVAWDQEDFDINWAKYHCEYRQRRLNVIINPWVWIVKYRVLSTMGKPENV